LRIIEHYWQWARPLVERPGRPPGVVLHHTATSFATPESIHRYDIDHNRWSGFGYHIYVRKDGTIHRGRPLDKMGAHCLNHNDWIGVCAEGNFVHEEMGEKQLAALKWVVALLRDKYGDLPFKPHREMPSNSTVCPGKNYPLAKVTAKPKPEVIKLPVPVVKPPWWSKMRRWLRLYKKRH
jgi:N-acetylmuramoyl-L-alanine amidase